MTQPEHKTEPGYETADMDARKVWLVALILVLGLILTSVICVIYYWVISVRMLKREGPLLPPVPKAEAPFPRPELQSDPAEDLAKFRQKEDAVLTGYRWIDAKAGVVQIPIDRAMELLVQRGLPSGKSATRGPTWAEAMQQRAQQGTAGDRAERRRP